MEFKHASGGFPGNFWDTYSSFANTEGGTIIFGVEEKDGKLYLDVLSDEIVEKYRKDFWNNVNNKSTVSCNLLKNDDLEVAKFNGYNIMLFHIPCAAREQRPVFRTTNPYNGTFKRDYEGDYKCTEKEVQRMFADANVSTPADSRILQNYSLDDFDKESLQQYRQLFAVARPNHPWLGLDDMKLLEKLGGYRKDRETGEEGFTLAGLLMFGKYDSITDNACAPDFFPDYQEWMDNDPNGRWSARIYPDGTWEANYDNIKKGLVNVFGNGIISVEHNYLTTLSLAYSEGYVTNERLRYVLNLHKADITILLREMCAQGYLESVGYGRGTKYHLPQHAKASSVEGNIGSNLGSNPASNLGSNPISNLISNPISNPRKKRMSKDEIRKEIIAICADWVSLDYIAKTIERSTAYLLSDIIPPMLEEGLIERMYPETPRNPYQKYKRK